MDQTPNVVTAGLILVVVDWLLGFTMAKLPTHHPLDSWPAHFLHPMKLIWEDSTGQRPHRQDEVVQFIYSDIVT